MRWLLRKPSLPGDEAEGFGYVGIVSFAIWVFIALSAIEIPVMHLLVPWDGIRILVLILGVWGLTWMVGYFAGLRMHPHVVSATGLVVRNGPSTRIEIPWGNVASVRSRTRSYEEDRGMQFLHEESGSVQALVMSNQTSVDVVLREPQAVEGRKGTVESVVEVRFWADEPDRLAGAARARLEPTGSQADVQ